MSQTPQEEQPVLGFITVVKNKQIGGMLGGYLILNRNGRPVEFHCTAPVRPTKTQRILYGPTLDSYLMGEQIARALVLRSSVLPQLLITDIPQVQSLRSLVKPPVMLTEIPASPELVDQANAIESADSEKPTDSLFAAANSAEETLLPEYGTESGSNFSEAQEQELSEADAVVDLEKWRGSQEKAPQTSIVVPPGALLWCGILLQPDKNSLRNIQKTDRQNAERILRDLEIDYDLAEPFERIRDAIREAQKSAA